MTFIIVNYFWQFLLAIAAVALFSFVILFVGIYIREYIRDKTYKKRHPAQKSASKPPENLEIMGAPQPVKRQSPPNAATESQPEKPAEKPATFAREIPSGELDRVFGTEETDEPDLREDPDPDIDYEEEETELMEHRSNDETVSATGVSFDELQTTTQLLQKNHLQADERKALTNTAAKLAQTDLWDKIIESLPGANEKIAKMLDGSATSSRPKQDWESFDIRSFI